MTLEEHCEDVWPLGWRPAGKDRAQAKVVDFSLIVQRTGSTLYTVFHVRIHPKDSIRFLFGEREEEDLRELLQWAFTYVKDHPPYIPELTP